jgi:hypothetical protein
LFIASSGWRIQLCRRSSGAMGCTRGGILVASSNAGDDGRGQLLLLLLAPSMSLSFRVWPDGEDVKG